MRERNKCQHCGQRSQNDWSRPLDGGLDNRMIWIKAVCLIGMNLTDQNERVPHQDTRQTDETENGIKSKRRVKFSSFVGSNRSGPALLATIFTARMFSRTWVMV